jgi:hypothetical protein
MNLPGFADAARNPPDEREDAEKIKDAERVLVDEQQRRQMRQAAAYDLGRIGTLEAVAVLRSNLGIDDMPTKRAVITALGRAGGQEDLRAIDELLKHSDGLPLDVIQAAEWARTLLAYRLGADGFELPAPRPTDFVELAPSGTRPVESRPVDAQTATKAVNDLSAEGFGIPLDPDSGIVVRCGDQDYLYLQNRQYSAPDAAKRLMQRKSMLGVVAVRYTDEIDAFSTMYLVLTHPSQVPNRAQILLTSSAGVPAFAGEAVLEQDQASFAVRTVESPGAIPAELQGVFDQGQLRVEQGLFEPHRVLQYASPFPNNSTEFNEIEPMFDAGL